MENNRKPAPLLSTPPGKTCPICGKRSYSPSGIHPQCAVQQADAPRMKRLSAEKRAKKELELAGQPPHAPR